MTEASSGFTAVRLEKAAIDNGFDRELARDGEWLVYGSTHAPLQVWLAAPPLGGRLLVALSRADVARGVTEMGSPVEGGLPPGASVVLDVENISALTRLLRRAYQLARTLPHELLKTFSEKTSTLPRSTEAERLVVQRVGQDVFREGLLEYWEGKCAVTGLAVPELLRASHIKPWAACETDAERLDVFNGLLLAPHLDALFDKGFITFDDKGACLVSSAVADFAREQFRLDRRLRLRRMEASHLPYLAWHRRDLFKAPERYGKGVGLPKRLDLPCFVYGVFKPGEVSHHQLEPLLDAPPVPAVARGEVLMRDGLPILDPKGGGISRGYLLRFGTSRAEEAYRLIGALEPSAQYKWAESSLEDPAESANFLVACAPEKGSDHLEAPAWSSAGDPLFTDLLDVVEAVAAKDGRDREWHTKKTGFDWHRFFRLQAAYLLLWSAIERFTALRYGAWRDPMERIRMLGDDPAFGEGLRTVAPEERVVFDSRNPDDMARLKADKPVKAVDYYYQVRSNLSHRGKGAMRDGEIVRQSLAELLAIFRLVLASTLAGDPAREGLTRGGNPAK